jgi:hypothetical protein
MAGETPKFFIPGMDAAQAEKTYQGMAKHSGANPNADRVFSITFEHNGETWTATVGEKLRGFKAVVKRGRESMQQKGDNATVWAIFPGNPYVVYTSAIPTGPDRSAWANPFMAGHPTRVQLFARD